MKRLLLLGLSFLFVLAAGVFSFAGEQIPTLTDKTLVVWAAPDNLEQRGGSAFTIDMANPDAFDGIVFGELEERVWMPGSSFLNRTARDQSAWPKETKAGEFVRIAVVYQGSEVRVYRNNDLVASYPMPGSPQAFTQDALFMIGPRHDVARNSSQFVGKVKDARVYPVPLTAEQIASLEPGKPLDGVEPWAWWDFGGTGLFEKTGRFNLAQLEGDAKIADGALVLGEGKGVFTARRSAYDMNSIKLPEVWSPDGPVPDSVILSARVLREKFLADPFRPRWHFTVPEGNGMPGDPNGCFWANGEYHLMYLYGRGGGFRWGAGGGFCWGHISSTDLVHWRHHPDAIGPSDKDEGCFSGGGFIDDDGTAWVTYWQLWKGGIGVAKSVYPYDKWEKPDNNRIIPSTEFGVYDEDTPNGKILFGSADPSNIWKKDGKYYVLTGNYWVLDKYGRAEDSPEELKGDYLDLFESTDLKTWVHKGVFYRRNPEWTDASEDDMCPSFLPLAASPEGGAPSGKHLLLFISHNKGCQYYVGTYDTANDKFIPETHGRMTAVDNTYFAPEALVDGKGRQIMWSWLLDNRNDEYSKWGWSGVYGLPRVLWAGEDGTLRMRPVPELESLRLHEKDFGVQNFTAEKPAELTGFEGDSFELEFTIPASELAKTKRVGAVVREDKTNGEKTLVYYDAETKELVFDGTKSGKDGRPAREALPFTVAENEPLSMRVFVDKSVVEVYANDRQAIGRRAYPANPESAMGVSLFTESGSVRAENVRAWDMAPANPY